MNRDKTVSDEQLNAYIDGQLDLAERSRLLESLRDNPDYDRYGCKLNKVHDLVRLTYQSEPIEQSPDRPRLFSRRWLQGLAAMLLMGFGALLGWSGFHLSNPGSLIELARTVHMAPTDQSQQPWRVMLHISSDQPRRFTILLNEVENLLQTRLRNQQAVEVEILANGKGLELIRNRNNPHAQRLKALQSRYRNLVVSACNETLTRLREEGKTVELLPQTRIVSSALRQALTRQQQGWTYIRL